MPLQVLGILGTNNGVGSYVDVCGSDSSAVEMALHAHSRLGSKKKIKSFEGLQTQPSPLPSEKAATTRNASTTITNNNKHYLNIFIYYLFIFIVLFCLLLKRCELLLLFLRGGVKAASGGPQKI